MNTAKFAGQKAQMREADKFAEKNVKEDGNKRDQRHETINTQVSIYTFGSNKNEETALLAFQAAGDDEYQEDDRRGGRGGRGRGGRGGRDRPQNDGARRGGRGQGKLKITDDDFPTL